MTPDLDAIRAALTAATIQHADRTIQSADRALQQERKGQKKMAFHSHDGWFFERLDLGVVRVWHQSAGETTTVEVEFDPGTWASIVAAVSRAGEDGATFRLAQWLHGAMPDDWVLNNERLSQIILTPAT